MTPGNTPGNAPAPGSDPESDAATTSSKRASRYVTWIVSILFYSVLLYLVANDFSQKVQLAHRIQTQGERGRGVVMFNEPYIVQRGSARDHKGYKLRIQGQGDHGLLEFVSPRSPSVGSEVAYIHLPSEFETRVIDPANPNESFVRSYILGWYGLLQMGGMLLLAVMILVTLRCVILAAMGRPVAV